MRRNFEVNRKKFLWLSDATKCASINDSIVLSKDDDELDFMINKIEEYKIYNGVLRRHELMNVLESKLGKCFTYNALTSKKRDHKEGRTFIIWLLSRICELPMSSIGDYFNIDRNTAYKSVERFEGSVFKKDKYMEIFGKIL